MDYQIVERNNRTILECMPEGGLIHSEQDILDLIGECGMSEKTGLLLFAGNLPPDFFDLKTGLAGKLLLKLSTYRVPAAAVIPSNLIGNGRFYEMVLENNRRNDFRFFETREEAIKWFDGLA